MGLLDSVIGGLMGGGSGTSPGMGNVLSNLLTGGSQAGMGGGGLGGLLQQLQRGGLGDVAQSWVSNGPNRPVAPHELQNAFGEERVQDMARQAGMEPPDFLNQLARHLPNAVDGMTPHGRLPDEGSVSV